MTRFRLVLESTRMEDLAALASLADEKGIHFNCIEKMSDKRHPPQNRSHQQWHKEPAKRLLAAMVAGKEYHYQCKEFVDIMKELNLAPDTANPVLSWMVDTGKAQRIRRGVYVKT